MKGLVLICSMLMLASCATRAPLSYNQKCGVKGMVLAGVSSESGSTSSYNYNFGASNGHYSGENVQCVVPQNKKQQCEALIFQRAATPVLEYNEYAGTKEFFNGLGYYALIVPGIVMKVAFDGQRDEAVAKAQEMEKEAIVCNSERETASE